jgi:hypothetical protein
MRVRKEKILGLLHEKVEMAEQRFRNGIAACNT